MAMESPTNKITASMFGVNADPSAVTAHMVMEYLQGFDLEHLLKERHRLPATEAVDYVLQACEALAEAHALGIVHRDIKPANCFITHRADGSPLVKVLDFGISKVTLDEQTSLTQTDSVLGTPAYMCPEQLRGSSSVDARADIWSLGVMLFECVSGTRPFQGDSFSALAIKIAMEPTPMLAGPYPTGFDGVVYRCLQKDPSRRVQTIAELVDLLAPYAGDKRAASIVAERTRGIFRATPYPFPDQEAPPFAVHASAAQTTLGASVGIIQSPPPASWRPRVVLAIGTTVLVMTIGVLVARQLAGGADSPTAAKPRASEPILAPTTPGVPLIAPAQTVTPTAAVAPSPATRPTPPVEPPPLASPEPAPPVAPAPTVRPSPDPSPPDTSIATPAHTKPQSPAAVGTNVPARSTRPAVKRKPKRKSSPSQTPPLLSPQVPPPPQVPVNPLETRT